MESVLENNKILPCKKIILCCISGLFAACSFPKMNLFFLMWIAFVPLIFAVADAGVVASFLYGFISGFVFNAVGLYWLVPVLQFNFGSYLQTILISCIFWCYLALYWGLWSLGLSSYVSFQKNKFSNFFTVVFGACLWVLLEYIRTYIFTGFPWMLIGYSQFRFIEIIQIAELTGVYGVSFLILFCNLCFYFWLACDNKRKYLYVPMVLIACCMVFGLYKIYKFRLLGEKEYNVLIFQPNIDQCKKWNKGYRHEIFSDLRRQSVEAVGCEADLVLWPETVIPCVIQESDEVFNFARRLAVSATGLNILGSLYKDGSKEFNVVLGFKGADCCKSVHRKNHLVPFGEFVPFGKSLLRFFGISDKVGNLEEGADSNLFSDGELAVGPVICSENFSPDVARRFVLNGAKVLTNHTNDAWFFDTAAPYQHFIMNVFRAVENRKFVLVSANSGISGIIEASGLIIDKTNALERKLLIETFFQNDFRTFYTKFGDVFVKICFIALLLFIAVLPFKRRETEIAVLALAYEFIKNKRL
ncbi:MAG: apolipoprotein N-acyltransferase [Endomicrobium sp.]|jgi:apolipoprotein N-acyltransferase|nr:apolipoprotein N-acyltransferase [Endomicrobium sp.]